MDSQRRIRIARTALKLLFQWGHDPEVMVRIVSALTILAFIRFNGATTRRSW